MQAPHAVHPEVSVAQVASDALPLADTVERYFDEISRSGAIAAKTEGDKRDALGLMSELTGDKPPAHMTKVDAQNIKAAIMKLPKNRSKNPETRNLTLSEMLSVSDVERLTPRTMNTYLGNMQTFFTWAVSNGYATNNIFSGLKFRKKKGVHEDGRKAYSAEHLQTTFLHLTDADSPLVKKDVHKWPALIGMFSGMRLN